MASEPVEKSSRSRSENGRAPSSINWISISPDGPFPSAGRSEVEGIFDPPYFEWFQFSADMTEYTNFDECLSFIEDYMLKNGPFDGLLGFSQGAVLSAARPGLQEKGVALTKVPKIKFVIIIGGAKFLSPFLAEKAYSPSITCPSLHFLGEVDFLMPAGLELLESFVEPLVINHPKGHTVPRLDEKKFEDYGEFHREDFKDNQLRLNYYCIGLL